MLHHVVMMKFLEPAQAAQAQEQLEALTAQIPALLSMEVGLDVLRSEASYDLVLRSTHEDLEGLRDYQEHQAHQEFLAWLRPLLAARASVDVVVP